MGTTLCQSGAKSLSSALRVSNIVRTGRRLERVYTWSNEGEIRETDEGECLKTC